MIESEITTLLKNNTTLNGLINGRVYPLVAPQNVVKPYITYQVINNSDISSFGGEVYENRVRFQIDIYGTTYSSSKAVLNACKEALYTFRKYPHNINYMENYESDTQLYRQLIDFNLTL